MKSHCPNNCKICKDSNAVCYYDDNNLSFRCPVCKEYKSPHDIYEYRGYECCPGCLDKLKEKVDFQRQEKREKDKHIYDRYKGLDLASNSKIDKANREIFGL